ncbi:MAG: NifB/NifX family molybdenum-iron cluster-binding protein [Spirochaetales bacterium]|nr:NifB/NifX family molybdenum-iron cluster-binding protein [Spirochaetales bacterium]
MKICVTSQGDSIDSPVDPRFGRCAFFVIVDTDTMKEEAFRNDAAAEGGGAGIQAGQFVAEKGARVVLTGNVGPNAFRTLSAAGIEICPAATGTVKQAVLKYKFGELKPATGPSVDSHAGMGGGA